MLPCVDSLQAQTGWHTIEDLGGILSYYSTIDPWGAEVPIPAGLCEQHRAQTQRGNWQWIICLNAILSLMVMNVARLIGQRLLDQVLALCGCL